MPVGSKPSPMSVESITLLLAVLMTASELDVFGPRCLVLLRCGGRVIEVLNDPYQRAYQ